MAAHVAQRWEAAALVLVGAVSAKAPNYPVSMFRHAVERMDLCTIWARRIARTG
jgi:hypothetical protein